ncbi:purine-nucleoside phosphorylase [Elusimicrobiota bacterium]
MEKSIEKTVKYIRKKSRIVPKIGIILGSGFGKFSNKLDLDAMFDYKDIPGFVSVNVEGHAGRFMLGKIGGRPIALMNGRLHYYEGHSMREITYPIRAMKSLGIEYLIVIAAVGGLKNKYKAGNIALIKDHINFMGDNPLRGSHEEQYGERFPDMSSCYDQNLRKKALEIAQRNNIKISEAVYFGVRGPSYETPSEIKCFEMLGGDVIGMSVIPEAIVANQMGIKILGISYITNLAAGLSKEPLSHKEVLKTAKDGEQNMAKILLEMIKQI